MRVKQHVQHADEKGMILVISMVLILLLTLIGMVGMEKAGQELTIASNYKTAVKTFYTAEAGLPEGKRFLHDHSVLELRGLISEHDGVIVPRKSTGALDDGTQTRYQLSLEYLRNGPPPPGNDLKCYRSYFYNLSSLGETQIGTLRSKRTIENTMRKVEIAEYNCD